MHAQNVRSFSAIESYFADCEAEVSEHLSAAHPRQPKLRPCLRRSAVPFPVQALQAPSTSRWRTRPSPAVSLDNLKLTFISPWRRSLAPLPSTSTRSYRCTCRALISPATPLSRRPLASISRRIPAQRRNLLYATPSLTATPRRRTSRSAPSPRSAFAAVSAAGWLTVATSSAT